MTTIETVQPKKKRGCFFYGCITCIILALLVVIGGVAGVFYLRKAVNNMVMEYTDTKPMDLPNMAMTPEDFKKLNDRMAAFDAAIDAHTNVPPLVLSGADLNALINDSGPLKKTGGKIYLTLDGSKIEGQISMPLDKIDALWALNTKGRYLNGDGTFMASVVDGNLSVTISSLEVKGKPVPEKYLAGLQTQLAQLVNNQTNQAAFESYQSITVTNGTLMVTPKKN